MPFSDTGLPERGTDLDGERVEPRVLFGAGSLETPGNPLRCHYRVLGRGQG